jgi:hypothetical protein
VAKAFSPWVQPDGFLNCGTWVSDRLECEEPGSNRKALICAIALKKMFVATHDIQRNTSVTMRGHDSGSNTAQLEALLKNEINPKIKSCEKFFSEKIAIAWTIKSTGQVADATIAENRGKDQFGACALKVIKSHTFPSFPGDIKILTSFK